MRGCVEGGVLRASRRASPTTQHPPGQQRVVQLQVAVRHAVAVAVLDRAQELLRAGVEGRRGAAAGWAAAGGGEGETQDARRHSMCVQTNYFIPCAPPTLTRERASSSDRQPNVLLVHTNKRFIPFTPPTHPPTHLEEEARLVLRQEQPLRLSLLPLVRNVRRQAAPRSHLHHCGRGSRFGARELGGAREASAR